jgi:hypothetical protein
VGKEAVKERMNLLMQENAKRQRLAALRRDTARKIDFLRHKAVIEYREVYTLIRDFFKEFLEQRYEFTTNELRAELKKIYISNTVRAQISALLDELQAIEYATVHYSREELIKILHDFEEVVVQLVRIHTNAKSFLDRLRAFFMRDDDEQESIIADLPSREENDAYHVRIYTLVERCYVALNQHRMRKAKIAYKHVLSEYNLLDDERKKQYYPVIEQTYADIINRAKMGK